MMGVSKRDLFSVAGLNLGPPDRYDFRDPLPELRPWPDRIPAEFRHITFKLVDGTEMAIVEERAFAVLCKAEEIILMSMPLLDPEDVPAFKERFQTWWRELRWQKQ
jgi:hypothetical protein